MRSVFLIPLLLAATCLSTGGALAQGECVEPPMPAAVQGTAVSPDQMRAAMAEAHTFIAQASVYQECLLKEVEAGKTQAAAGGQPFEPMIETSARYKVEASKKAQERVGAAANGALTAFKNH
ncbi:MAG: hypothetical protein H0U98_08380 [Alphaproteobacteria bacterium]|nr:hypothetical protein [Alphaproteobacteria bacterium]